METRAIAVLAGAAAVLLAGCDSNGGTVSLPPVPSVAPTSAASTSITVSGAITGTLATPGASCVAGGPAGVVVNIQGTINGAYYLLTFDAPKGSTDLAGGNASRVVVELAPLQGAGNWGANPSRQLGSGTVVVNSNGGTLDLHLVAGAGSPSAATVDVSGTYGCSNSV